METWFIIIVSLCISSLLKSILNILFYNYKSSINNSLKKKLPPGPSRILLICNLLWQIRHGKPITDLGSILRRLKLRYGPLITLKSGRIPLIFVSGHSLSLDALVKKGSLFCDRPPPPINERTIFNTTGRIITSAPYGPTWRSLRRNLTVEILHPTRVRTYSDARSRVVTLLIRRLLNREKEVLKVIDHFNYAMYSLSSLMCFGHDLNDNQIEKVEAVQRRSFSGFSPFSPLVFWPRLGKILFRGRWKALMQLRKDQEDVFVPLIKTNRERINVNNNDEIKVVSYVETLLNLQIREGNNISKLDEGEIVNLCSEFLNAGTDTSSTALQWIMANLVKYPHIQTKLYEEIFQILGQTPPLTSSSTLLETVNENELQKMTYLKAIILEGLRRHPPSHFLLPHKVTRDVELEGYVIPKNARVLFMVNEIGWDPEVWEDPMEFKPERFLGIKDFDVTGKREIKMMPFGAGRRMCPAYEMALFQLEYFVANLIWYFEWRAIEGDSIDLSEKLDFTTVMKNPLLARISLRRTST
ncbi:hypothetical protein ACJIZ3_013818 [Penstemon smallii]|uniref:Cytochrome P450 n=1 Tax=Penstemon smallii TaxID=265156 RepID=A0ABD3RUA2_9LAMI